MLMFSSDTSVFYEAKACNSYFKRGNNMIPDPQICVLVRACVCINIRTYIYIYIYIYI